MNQLTLDDYVKQVGGSETLSADDAKDLRAGTKRVFELMKNGGWFSADQICFAAGLNGCPAREGLRRLRSLRGLYTIERQRGEGRNFIYRLKI